MVASLLNLFLILPSEANFVKQYQFVQNYLDITNLSCYTWYQMRVMFVMKFINDFKLLMSFRRAFYGVVIKSGVRK
jgi:hypothetical protein